MCKSFTTQDPELSSVTDTKVSQCYNAEVGRASFERQKEVNREYVLVATHRMCKTSLIFFLNLIN
jgi:hypothetical protein